MCKQEEKGEKFSLKIKKIKIKMINDGRVIFFFCCAIEGVASAAASAAARSKRIKTVLCDDIYKNDQVITLYQIFGLFASPRRDR